MAAHPDDAAVHVCVEKKQSVSFEVTRTSNRDVGCSEIMENFLYLGSGRDANNVKMITQLGITHVLCLVSGWTPKVDWTAMSVNFLHLPIHDRPAAEISTLFSQSFEFIDSAKAAESKILVHCAAGISRSSTIVIAYLMKSYSMNLKTAYELVYTRRNIIRPNVGFFSQLMRFELTLYDQPSLVPTDLVHLRRPATLSMFVASESKILSVEEGMAWAKTVITEDLLSRIFLEICGDLFIPEKTSDFLDKVIIEARALLAVQEMQKAGYKWPKLSLNIMKTASLWYKAKKENL